MLRKLEPPRLKQPEDIRKALARRLNEPRYWKHSQGAPDLIDVNPYPQEHQQDIVENFGQLLQNYVPEKWLDPKGRKRDEEQGKTGLCCVPPPKLY